ncbi:Leucine-rich repeat protein 1 [Sciurus carolinensis]|uniref:Leucine-rich repeat protein 1 n=1 Tax=Sciurus carolinensis TaxID=30640 RepID=A0AA41MRI1_SCICA|nr:Leucine-rich repeat protein 1 [Sciurus carolinensis]
MKLHCEVEVISRHLPALGLRNRGKGVRAVLSLCQQAPGSQLRPRARDEPGGPRPACLLISTMKDKRGTRYEVSALGAGRRARGVGYALFLRSRGRSPWGLARSEVPEPDSALANSARPLYPTTTRGLQSCDAAYPPENF